MLADPRSDQFVENFTGQWLQLRKLTGIARDQDKFPGFNESLSEAMRAETEKWNRMAGVIAGILKTAPGEV